MTPVAVSSQSRPVSVQSGEAPVAGAERGKVDIIKWIGAGGSAYASSRMRPSVVECIVAERVLYPYSQPGSH